MFNSNQIDKFHTATVCRDPNIVLGDNVANDALFENLILSCVGDPRFDTSTARNRNQRGRAI